MRFKFIQSDDKNEVIVYCKDKTKLVEEIEKLCKQDDKTIIGYDNGIIKELNPLNIECFITEDEKVYAITDNKRYLLKKRLYELNEMLNETFIYINKGCLANFNKIDCFDASIGGTLLVIFKCGYKDYVSRRQLKNIKERIIKK